MAYNPTKKHAYDLPANKTRSYWKDQTHKGEGFNELSFEDQNGQEKVYLHAEKDHEIHVENNLAIRANNSSSTSVGTYSNLLVGNTNQKHVGGNDITVVGFGYIKKIVSKSVNRFSDFLDQLGLQSEMAKFISPGEGNKILVVAKNIFAESGHNTVLKASKSIKMEVGENITSSAQGDVFVLAEGNSYTTTRKKHIYHTGESFEVRCGKARILITKDGNIKLEGEHIMLNGKRIDLN